MYLETLINEFESKTDANSANTGNYVLKTIENQGRARQLENGWQIKGHSDKEER